LIWFGNKAPKAAKLLPVKAFGSVKEVMVIRCYLKFFGIPLVSPLAIAEVPIRYYHYGFAASKALLRIAVMKSNKGKWTHWVNQASIRYNLMQVNA
jgi:hypothetical protein